VIRVRVVAFHLWGEADGVPSRRMGRWGGGR
jgi:hypothetical protein